MKTYININKLRKWVLRKSKPPIKLHITVDHNEIIHDDGTRTYTPNGRIRYFGTIKYHSQSLLLELTKDQWVKVTKKYYSELHN